VFSVSTIRIWGLLVRYRQQRAVFRDSFLHTKTVSFQLLTLCMKVFPRRWNLLARVAVMTLHSCSAVGPETQDHTLLPLESPVYCGTHIANIMNSFEFIYPVMATSCQRTCRRSLNVCTSFVITLYCSKLQRKRLEIVM
jgi:hypothetical protein